MGNCRRTLTGAITVAVVVVLLAAACGEGPSTLPETIGPEDTAESSCAGGDAAAMYQGGHMGHGFSNRADADDLRSCCCVVLSYALPLLPEPRPSDNGGCYFPLCFKCIQTP